MGRRIMIVSALAAAFLIQGQPQEQSCSGVGAEVEAICAVLSAQQDAWNEGDIPGFMAGYWASEDLRFASGGSVTTGWSATLERYLARYDTPEAMGWLAFTDLDVTQLSEEAAYVFGRWTLYRESDEPTGLFTLILRKEAEGWRVVHDHTSSAD
ncbi:YybH family protein [Oceanicaulis sp. LC35]|uniref:YybH family protein n=1 Tax=Oceanicaulis sp. LC35 TaxID=3349635 RepID=UPI003F8499FA